MLETLTPDAADIQNTCPVCKWPFLGGAVEEVEKLRTHVAECSGVVRVRPSRDCQRLGLPGTAIALPARSGHPWCCVTGLCILRSQWNKSRWTGHFQKAVALRTQGSLTGELAACTLRHARVCTRAGPCKRDRGSVGRPQPNSHHAVPGGKKHRCSSRRSLSGCRARK